MIPWTGRDSKACDSVICDWASSVVMATECKASQRRGLVVGVAMTTAERPANDRAAMPPGYGMKEAGPWNGIRTTRSMTMLSAAAARLLFYPTLAYNVLMEKISSRCWFNRIDDSVLLGALPFRSMTKQLVEQENVRGVVTMNEEYETKYFCNSVTEWQRAGVEQLVLSTVDLTGVPSLADLHRGVEFTLGLRGRGCSVYIHCKAGRSRSATMAAAYLIKLHRYSPEEAVSSLASIRPHILIRSAQLDMLRTYHQEVCGAQSH